MYVRSKNAQAQIFHNNKCPYAKRIKRKNRIFASKQNELLEAGYKRCKCCGAVIKAYQNEQSKIEDFCHARYMRVEFVCGEMYVITSISTWKIIMYSKRLYVLFHQNGYNRPRKSGDRMPISQMCFHEQKTEASTLIELIQYIGNHDMWRENEKIEKFHTARNMHSITRSKKQKRKPARYSIKQRRNQIRNVLALIDQVAICSGDYSQSYIVNC